MSTISYLFFRSLMSSMAIKRGPLIRDVSIVSTLDRSIYCCKRLLKFYLIFICKYFRHKAVSSTDNKI